MMHDENYRDKPIEKFMEKFEKLSEGSVLLKGGIQFVLLLKNSVQKSCFEKEVGWRVVEDHQKVL